MKPLKNLKFMQIRKNIKKVTKITSNMYNLDKKKIETLKSKISLNKIKIPIQKFSTETTSQIQIRFYSIPFR